MAEGEDASRVVAMRPPITGSNPSPANGASFPKTVPPLVAFHRTELAVILRAYGRMVAAGEWRDYALDHGREQAVFSIYRRMGEVPLYRVCKTPKLRNRQGQYSVLNAQGMVLKRGHELETVLKLFDKKRHLSLVGD